MLNRARILTVQDVGRPRLDEQAEAYTAVLPLIAGGQIAPAHDRSFPLEQAPEALRPLIEDRPFGTVTLTVDALSVR
jgi:NADPH:quinone reductase-like Zn-dependent oxidoreductase